MKDRLGNKRCAGYRKEHFEVCKASGCVKGMCSNVCCSVCGGYGGHPKSATALDIDIEKDLAEPMPPEYVVAMTIWGVAKNLSYTCQKLIACIIYNRAIRRSAVTGSILFLSFSEVCTQSQQFPCWIGKIKLDIDTESASWGVCSDLAKEIFNDSYVPLSNATHFYKSENVDFPVKEFLVKIDGIYFYKDDNCNGIN